MSSTLLLRLSPSALSAWQDLGSMVFSKQQVPQASMAWSGEGARPTAPWGWIHIGKRQQLYDDLPVPAVRGLWGAVGVPTGGWEGS